MMDQTIATPAFTTERTEGAEVSASASGPRRVRANRANARKSTGPKTSRGKRFSSANATKWGLAAGNGRHLMARLGEDPEAFDALRERLEDEWQPATETARQLVAELAELFWKQARLARAEQALVARQVEELVEDRAALSGEIGRAHSPAPVGKLYRDGLWSEPDSPGKFEDLIAHLGALAEEAEARRATGPWEVMANLIWGASPTIEGQAIRSLFHKFGEAAKPGGAPLDEEHVGTMVASLHEEIRRARDAYRAWRERHVEITPAVLESAWAPTAPEWTLLIRQRNSVFRQIERTLRLLVTVAAVPSPRPSVGASPRPAPTAKKCKTKPISFLESTKPHSNIKLAGRNSASRQRSGEDSPARFPGSPGENASM